MARTTSHEQLEGEEQTAGLRIVIEWPSKKAATSFLDDPAYAPHLKARTAGSVSHHYLIEANHEFA